MYQTTIRNSFTLDGIAIHSGNLSQITLHAAQPNSGIVFRRDSSKIGNNVIMAGGSAVINNITIGHNSVVLARTMVTKNMPENSMVSGYTARSHKRQLRESAALSRLPKTIKKLNEKLDELSKTREGAK
ncbi:UDP-3-O-acyl-N-acetylglucosamine deacetylase [Paenibacillus sp. JNUCC31]|uniref:UDP-3-O-acyl-N-acetylglucosamine deacetylase n=1 Tax=Paenibacillus sp. JNUCC-31 TaxID=2777983 RepID=UPI001786AC07|nr:UDP-3-O-acyl-N-acetylglucosamine deacetylase [Paenibacillus sp. JNUCC-31]QOS77231.1 UDP-3-O-acyl-N-acetylglucosamine deacetylase [Paenibacillus sp. JNUCC-31]